MKRIRQSAANRWNGVVALAVILIFLSLPVALNASVLPSIEANGQVTELALILGTPLEVSVSLDPGPQRGEPVELWIGAESSNTNYWYNPEGRWIASATPLSAYSGPMPRLSKIPVLDYANLAADTYRFTFYVDTLDNGVLDAEVLASDTLTLLLHEAHFKLPDSGQTSCFDVAGNPIACPVTGQPLAGQDAAYPRFPLSYTDRGDGVVLDNNTGLIWQQGGNHQIGNWYEAVGAEHPVLNPGAQTDICGTLELGGYTDWRLPRIEELTTILHLQLSDPSVDTLFFPDTLSSLYWTATSVASSDDSAWLAYFYNSFLDTQLKHNRYPVRCVRGAEHTHGSEHLVDNDDGTVLDRKTDLIWQQGEGGLMDWEASLAYCEALVLGGRDDWRLPNVRELHSLVDFDRVAPALDTRYFPDVSAANYWASTSYILEPSYACCIDFNRGYVSSNPKLNQEFVRCVRENL